jgi:hypothetical protein
MEMVLELAVVVIATSLCFMKYQNRAHDGMCPAVSNMWSVMLRLSESGVLGLGLDPPEPAIGIITIDMNRFDHPVTS